MTKEEIISRLQEIYKTHLKITQDIIRKHCKELEHPIRKLGGLNAIKKEMGIAVFKPKPSIVLNENEQLLLLKYEKRQLETFIKKLLKKKALDDNIVEAVKNTALALPKAPFIKSKISVKTTKTEQSAVLIIADPHCREVVRPEHTRGLGGYNKKIFVTRLQYIADEVKDLILNHHVGDSIKELYVVFLGDNDSGVIHDELIETSEGVFSEAAVVEPFIFAQFIRDLTSVVKNIIVVGAGKGNHSRFTKKKQFKNPHNNMDYVIYQNISVFLAGHKNVDFIIPQDGSVIFNIRGWNFFATHGDNVGQSNFRGIPWYGIDRQRAVDAEIMMTQNQKIHYYLLGHFHRGAIIDAAEGQTIVSPSIKGPDEYGLGRGLFSAPKQFFFGVHAHRGKSFLYDINLNFATPVENPRYIYEVDSPLAYQMREMGWMEK